MWVWGCATHTHTKSVFDSTKFTIWIQHKVTGNYFGMESVSAWLIEYNTVAVQVVLEIWIV